MTKTYTKDNKDEKKVIVKETTQQIRESQYTLAELDNIITDLEAKLAEWKATKQAALDAGVKA